MATTVQDVREALVSRYCRQPEVDACVAWVERQMADGHSFANRLSAITAWRQATRQR